MNVAKKMELFKNTTVYDWHEHIWTKNLTDELDIQGCDRLAEHARLLHIDKVVVSHPISQHTTPERIAALNNVVAEGVKRYPGLFYGMCFVDPHHGSQAVAEIERCVKELGFIGVGEQYTQRTIDDQLYYPIIEKCIKLDIPILMHAMKYSPPHMPPGEENTSHSAHFANIARQYPEAVFIIGHIGNGDRHWQLKGLADCPNVLADISGSAYDHNTVEAIVTALGIDRVIFAADGSFSASVGKLIGASLSDQDKLTILNGPRVAKYIDRMGA